MFKRLLLAAVLLGAGSVLAFARPSYSRWGAQEQYFRIEQGERKGRLTPWEADRLRDEVREIQRKRQAMLWENGGYPLTWRQRRILDADMERVSRRIWLASHDNKRAAARIQRSVPPPCPPAREGVAVRVRVNDRGQASGGIRVVVRD